VVSQDPFLVDECSVGTGAACASVYLDQAFESLLRKRFGKERETLLTEKRMAALVRHFDSSVKRQYDPFDPICETEFEIPIAGVPDIPEIGLEDGYLTLSRYNPLKTLLIRQR
jgi:hypothetical protein